MKQPNNDLTEHLALAEFPRARHYDPVWMLQNAMGPNPVWLAEALIQQILGFTRLVAMRKGE